VVFYVGQAGIFLAGKIYGFDQKPAARKFLPYLGL